MARDFAHSTVAEAAATAAALGAPQRAAIAYCADQIDPTFPRTMPPPSLPSPAWKPVRSVAGLR